MLLLWAVARRLLASVKPWAASMGCITDDGFRLLVIMGAEGAVMFSGRGLVGDLYVILLRQLRHVTRGGDTDRAPIRTAAQMGWVSVLLPISAVWMMLTVALDARLQLLDYFDLQVDGWSVPLGSTATEFMAYLGVVGVSSRDRMRISLWPDAAQDESLTRLRSLLYRLRQVDSGRLVECGPSNTLRLGGSLAVDYRDASRTAEDLCAGNLRARGQLPVDLRYLRGDLLPGDTSEWIAPHQRHWSRSRLRGLAVCARAALAASDTETAIQAAELVIRSEPFFEEMHEVIVQALTREGFVASARETYVRLEMLLRDELDCVPQRSFREIVAGVGTPGTVSS